MCSVITNSAYKIVVRADNGRLLHAQRAYLTQGVTAAGRKYYRDMRWFAYAYSADGTRREQFPGIPPQSQTKAALIEAITRHPMFRRAAGEL